LRDALNLLQQLSTYYGSEIGLQQVQATLGITGDRRARELVKHTISRDIPSGITAINSATMTAST
jgi:DNA polymerase III gamma/tau subunit